MAKNTLCTESSDMAKSTDKSDSLQEWKQTVLRWYPKLHERAYFVPPVHMMGINFGSEEIAGQDVPVPKAPVQRKRKGSTSVSESEELEHHEQQRVLLCLKKFCEKSTVAETTAGEVMFILSQLLFTNYLAGAARHFPRTVELEKENNDRGDFDILIIHRHYGLLAAEIKSVGTFFTGKTEDLAKEDTILVGRLAKIAKQLKKSEDVLRHLTSDMEGQPRITKTLILPNIAADQLKRVLAGNPKVRQALCNCFGIPDTCDQLDFCLTTEQLSDRTRFWEVTDDVMKGLDRWWATLMTSKGEDPVMTEEVYEELVARFAGPATTVEVFCPSKVSKVSKVVRTEGEGVSETAARFMALVLHQEQIRILHSSHHLVYLSGPPGTGKTVVLMLQAEQWLKDGHEVHVVSMFDEGMAAALCMAHSLQAKFPHLREKICLHTYSLETRGMDEAVEELASSAHDGHLYVIVDEVDGSAFKEFCDKLFNRVSVLHLWAARVYHDLLPEYFTEFVLRVPLRSPATVTREIQKSGFVSKFRQVREYDQNIYPHTDGPLIRELRHQGPDHPADVMPRDCEACGARLAAVLMELHVGDTTKQTSESGSPDPLQYRDVFLLCPNGFEQNATSSNGQILRACGIIKGLQQSGVPVTVLTASAARMRNTLLTEVATMQGPDTVIATSCQWVTGLERKIVAWVQVAESDEMSAHFERLQAFSRTSGQLITLTTPRCLQLPMVQNPPSLSELENAEGEMEPEMQAFDGQLERMFLELARACITEEMVQDVDAILQWKVCHRNGEERSYFLNLSRDGGSLERGVWTASRVAADVTIQEEDIPILLRGGIAGAFQLFQQGRIKVHMTCSQSLMRFEKYWRRIIALYQEMSGRKDPY